MDGDEIFQLWCCLFNTWSGGRTTTRWTSAPMKRSSGLLQGSGTLNRVLDQPRKIQDAKFVPANQTKPAGSNYPLLRPSQQRCLWWS